LRRRDDAFEKAFDAFDLDVRLSSATCLPGLGVEDGHRQRAPVACCAPKAAVGVGVHSEDRIGVAVFGPAKGNDLCIDQAFDDFLTLI
jgi:hypothetical protein